MASAIKAVYYYSNQPAHNLICEELCSTLVNRGHSVVVVAQSALPHISCLQHKVAFRQCQPDMVQRAKQQKDIALIDSEAAWLRAQKADVVVSAAVPWGCAAAAAAGICAVCIAHKLGGEYVDFGMTIPILPLHKGDCCFVLLHVVCLFQLLSILGQKSKK